MVLSLCLLHLPPWLFGATAVHRGKRYQMSHNPPSGTAYSTYRVGACAQHLAVAMETAVGGAGVLNLII